MNEDIIAYYAERAKEYEKIYEKPERQAELAGMGKLLQNLFAGKDVFEIACGTGYWTQRIAQTAKSVFATDINAPVIDIAKAKKYEKDNVNFAVADIFSYTIQPYESLFAGFMWSHIKLQELDRFIDAVHTFVKPGGLVVFIDNNYVADSSRPVIRTDEQGNTYQRRILENGSTYSVIKNFPAKGFLYGKLEGKASDIKFTSMQYYWVLSYTRK